MKDTRLTVPLVLPLVDAWYAIPGNGVGGSLHIVLDDGNTDDSDVEWCWAGALEHGDLRGAALAGVLLLMSRTQRAKLAARHRYWWDGAGEGWDGDLPAEDTFDALLAQLPASALEAAR